jgi:hypothetical protein
MGNVCHHAWCTVTCEVVEFPVIVEIGTHPASDSFSERIGGFRQARPG